MPLYDKAELEGATGFEVMRNDESLPVALNEAKAVLEEAICKASQLTSLRIGDYVTVEIEPQKMLAAREDGEVALKGRFCEKDIFEFKLIF